MLILFALAIFTSAALLFLIQPMAAKMALPIFGGSPAVWNTSMLFFQAALLLGYLYAHLVSTKLKPLGQVIAHAVFAGLTLLTLPILLPSGDLASWAQTPITSLLRFLVLTVGMPFLFTSTAGPLLQKWFSRTGHPQASDPYFLYSASNAGSLIGLLAYPFIIEPAVKLGAQGRLWSYGFGVMACLALVCGIVSWRAGRFASPLPATPTPASAKPIDRRRRLKWILLAFVPSSLMIGVTQHISTDVAAVPLLWVIPLTLYLLTFIIAFSETVKAPSKVYAKWTPFAAVPLMMSVMTLAREPVLVLAGIQLLFFLLLALMCHKRLAEDRPDPAHLTEFFLFISVGGVLGGLFNSLIAPTIFNRVYEYPLVLTLALLLRDDAELFKGRTSANVVLRWAAAPFAVLIALIVGTVMVLSLEPINKFLHHTFGQTLEGKLARGIFIAGFPTLICFCFHRWIVSYALGFGVGLLAVMAGIDRGKESSLHTERTFFGVYDVILSSNKAAHMLDHGTTRHGMQALDKPGEKDRKSFKPLTYYYPSGPIGDVMDFVAGNEKVKNYAFIGLGVGTLAAYGQGGESFDFYEIDPAMERIARNPDYFTYLRDSDARIKVILGDARLKLAEAPDHHYGLIVVDAFSSDAIPTHLLTVEALELYKRKLIDDGIIAFHVSNRFFDLIPLIGGLADSTGMRAAYRQDHMLSDLEKLDGKYMSEWIIVSRKERDIRPLVEKADWSFWPVGKSKTVWTDDYSSLWGVMR